jgi:hypothetical protein
MLKHFSHIRIEAKQTALESIVKKQTDAEPSSQRNGLAEESMQKSLHGLKNGAWRPTNKTIRKLHRRKKNGTALLRITNDYATF